MAELEIGQHCGVENCGQLGIVIHQVDNSPGKLPRLALTALRPSAPVCSLQPLTTPSAYANIRARMAGGNRLTVSSAVTDVTNFLPFVCDGCSRVFCLAHRSRDSHGCPELTTGSSSGGGQPEGSTQHPCTYTGCGGKELVEVLCPFCKKHFCLRHRHQPDHECDQLEAPKPRMAATQQLVKEIVDSKKSEPPNKVRRGAKNAATAAKVALMKLKLQAQGDNFLPQSERVYFQVYLPKGGKDKCKAMFFCKKWSIGKVVDSAASIANLKNDNNKATAKKLRLCHAETGAALPTDGSVDMWLSTAENPLHNGGNIIMEYLDNGCNKIEDPSVYFS